MGSASFIDKLTLDVVESGGVVVDLDDGLIHPPEMLRFPSASLLALLAFRNSTSARLLSSFGSCLFLTYTDFWKSVMLRGSLAIRICPPARAQIENSVMYLEDGERERETKGGKNKENANEKEQCYFLKNN